MVEVVFHDVNNAEAVAGPFEQVVVEAEVVGHGLVVKIVAVATSEPIAYATGGFWFYDERPFKQAFVQQHEETR